MKNDNIITRSNGQQYEYDADFDVYRRVVDMSNYTHWERFGWLYVSTVLTGFILLYTLLKN